LGVLATCRYIANGMTRLVVATRNRHKAEEIRAILGEHFRCLTLHDFPEAPKTVEDAETFAGNATKKAIELARWLAGDSTLDLRPEAPLVLADDSGLEVDALEGAPGVYSARFAAAGNPGSPSATPAGNSTDAANNAKLARLLEGIPSERRTARFRCVLALTPVVSTLKPVSSPVCYADDCELRTELFVGVCEGRIGFAPRGQGGFGYDPLFIPEGLEQSFAELGEEVKNKISHRASALAKLRERLLSGQSAE
jgi:XTP/dITP diphosphohydrolase